MIVLGIDPGLGGAIAATDGEEARVFDMPIAEVQGRRRIDHYTLADVVGMHALGGLTDAVAFVELAQASPNMGRSSAFNYGAGFGIVIGVLAHLRIRLVFVPPGVWKRALGLINSGTRKIGRDEKRDKNASLDRARQLYPQLAAELALKKHEGRAEALLIAHYGCEELGL